MGMLMLMWMLNLSWEDELDGHLYLHHSLDASSLDDDHHPHLAYALVHMIPHDSRWAHCRSQRRKRMKSPYIISITEDTPPFFSSCSAGEPRCVESERHVASLYEPGSPRRCESAILTGKVVMNVMGT